MSGPAFTTVFGRALVGELRLVAHRPYLVVTMDDLWPAFEGQLDGFKGRVTRDKWIEQAQKLASGRRPDSKAGERPKG